MFGQLRNLITQELALYPGRLSVMARIVTSATLIALVISTFQLPAASLSAFYTFLLSRDTPQATARTGGRILLAFLAGAAYAVVGVMLSVDYPLTHFLWVVCTLFLIFYVIRISPDYASAAAFSFVIATAIPAWDVTGPVDARLYATLWTTFSIAVGVVITVAVEYVFAAFQRENQLELELADRLRVLGSLLQELSDGKGVPDDVAGKLRQYATVGSSRLRLLLARSRLQMQYAGPMNALVSLSDRAVDLAAGLTHLDLHPTEDERARLRRLAGQTTAMREALRSGKPPQTEPIQTANAPAPGVPVLPELERSIGLMPHAFVGESVIATDPESVREGQQAPSLPWVEDAWTNPEHLYFALRGTLAATVSYVLYNALDWPGISTCLPTCIITALSNVGSSRQKQILRLIGAIIGGFGFGLAAQTLVLPAIDSITGFLLVFAAVNLFAAWVSTATPRIAYIGLQIALAWDLINLGEPRFQLSLSISRDRVVGVLVGILCMWAFFEPFQKLSAAEYMLDIFEANLLALRRLAAILIDRNEEADTVRAIRKLRNDLNNGFQALNTQAEAVVFEFGLGRSAQLAVRDSLLRWQPKLRTLFLLQLTALRYRIEIQMDTIAPAIREAQKNWDERLAAVLQAMADYIRDGRHVAIGGLAEFCSALHAAVHNHYGEELPPRAVAILSITQTIADVTANLGRDLNETRLPIKAHEAHIPENRIPSMQTR